MILKHFSVARTEHTLTGAPLDMIKRNKITPITTEKVWLCLNDCMPAANMMYSALGGRKCGSQVFIFCSMSDAFPVETNA